MVEVVWKIPQILAKFRDDSEMMDHWLSEHSSAYRADNYEITFSFPDEDTAILFKIAFL